MIIFKHLADDAFCHFFFLARQKNAEAVGNHSASITFSPGFSCNYIHNRMPPLTYKPFCFMLSPLNLTIIQLFNYSWIQWLSLFHLCCLSGFPGTWMAAGWPWPIGIRTHGMLFCFYLSSTCYHYHYYWQYDLPSAVICSILSHVVSNCSLSTIFLVNLFMYQFQILFLATRSHHAPTLQNERRARDVRDNMVYDRNHLPKSTFEGVD